MFSANIILVNMSCRDEFRQKDMNVLIWLQFNDKQIWLAEMMITFGKGRYWLCILIGMLFISLLLCLLPRCSKPVWWAVLRDALYFFNGIITVIYFVCTIKCISDICTVNSQCNVNIKNIILIASILTTSFFIEP